MRKGMLKRGSISLVISFYTLSVVYNLFSIVLFLELGSRDAIGGMGRKGSRKESIRAREKARARGMREMEQASDGATRRRCAFPVLRCLYRAAIAQSEQRASGKGVLMILCLVMTLVGQACIPALALILSISIQSADHVTGEDGAVCEVQNATDRKDRN
eukprot:2526027-Pleurochrysis_carterae.AAC.3